VLIFPQDEHERLLIQRLSEAGVTVERGVELVGLAETVEGVSARLKRGDGVEETCEAAFLAGCDGARSAVRESMGVTFPGGTYEQLFYVADVMARGPVMDQELHVAVDNVDFLAVFPRKQAGSARLIGAVRGDRAEDFGWDDVGSAVIRRLGLEVDKVNWFSTYHVHHRVAERFRQGRVFLLGDAAHIHSPVGGQGMNTGIGDAVNLAWKLAAVLQGRVDERILYTYEPERIAFARRLVATTDQVFTLVTRAAGLPRSASLGLVARLFPALTRGESARRFLFRTVSQTVVSYHKSPLSRGGAGRTVGGDRLPWAGSDSGTAGGDNFTPLASLDWQVHVYGAASPALQDACSAWGLPLREFPWQESFWRAGLMQDALYLVRPDGYVALADPNARVAALERYVDEWRLQPRPADHPLHAPNPKLEPKPSRARPSRRKPPVDPAPHRSADS
jgi:2-polyprenyl-6-methoxyphenol hydroxylase-like FAD-dependent oxidoreductase